MIFFSFERRHIVASWFSKWRPPNAPDQEVAELPGLRDEDREELRLALHDATRQSARRVCEQVLGRAREVLPIVLNANMATVERRARLMER